MATSVSKSVFKAKALEYFRAVEDSGVPLVITDRGVPVLELRPFRCAEPQRAMERLQGSVLHFEDPTEPVGLDAWDALA